MVAVDFTDCFLSISLCWMPAILVKRVWITGTQWRWQAAPFLGPQEAAFGEEFPDTTGRLASAAERHSSHEVTEGAVKRKAPETPRSTRKRSS